MVNRRSVCDGPMKNHPDNTEFVWMVDFDIFPTPADSLILPEAKKYYRVGLERYVWSLHQTGFLVNEKRRECKRVKFIIDLNDARTFESFNLFHLFSRRKLGVDQMRRWMLRLFDIENNEWKEILKYDALSDSFYFEGMRRGWEVTRRHRVRLGQEIDHISRNL